jgi:hypothetical protein
MIMIIIVIIIMGRMVQEYFNFVFPHSHHYFPHRISLCLNGQLNLECNLIAKEGGQYFTFRTVSGMPRAIWFAYTGAMWWLVGKYTSLLIRI